VPRASATCLGGEPVGPPQVVSPDPSTPYRLPARRPAEYQKIALVARADGRRPHPPRELFWYQDGRRGPAPRSGPCSSPGTGRATRLVVVDEAGQPNSVSYKVESGRGRREAERRALSGIAIRISAACRCGARLP